MEENTKIFSATQMNLKKGPWILLERNSSSTKSVTCISPLTTQMLLPVPVPPSVYPFRNKSQATGSSTRFQSSPSCGPCLEPQISQKDRLFQARKPKADMLVSAHTGAHNLSKIPQTSMRRNEVPEEAEHFNQISYNRVLEKKG